MTVFKAFLRILNRNKWTVLLYSAILIIFSAFSLQSAQTTVTFEAVKPDLYLINYDADQGITHSLVTYLSEKNNLIDLSGNTNAVGTLDPDTSSTINSDAVSDALFYRRINLAVEIPAGFRADFLAGKNPALTIKSAGDYNAALAEMALTRFLDVANQYLAASLVPIPGTSTLATPPANNPTTPPINSSATPPSVDETTLIKNLETTLAVNTEVELTSTRDASSLDRAAFYYSFMNYPLLVGCIYIIATIMLSFREQKVARRIAMGGLTPQSINRILLAANSLFALCLWLIYVLISFIVVGPVMFSLHGLWFIINSGVFTLCAAALAFLIANLLKGRNAISGITNVVGLGSSFLCGAFVPMTLLPDSVIFIAHALPSYWYISANNLVAALETFSFSTLQPIILHLLIILAFSLVFILLANVLSRRRQ